MEVRSNLREGIEQPDPQVLMREILGNQEKMSDKISKDVLPNETFESISVMIHRFKCGNTGCTVEYSREEYLDRHLSRCHRKQDQLPVNIGDKEISGMEKADAIGNEEVLCLFCCGSNDQSLFKMNNRKKGKLDLASDENFVKFLEEVVKYQQVRRTKVDVVLDLLMSMEQFSVCQQCFDTIGFAMGTKAAAEEVENRVEQLRRQFYKEVELIESELTQFQEEITVLNEMILKSDQTRVEKILQSFKDAEKSEHSEVVLMLRDGVAQVLNEVGGSWITEDPTEKRKSLGRRRTRKKSLIDEQSDASETKIKNEPTDYDDVTIEGDAEIMSVLPSRPWLEGSINEDNTLNNDKSKDCSSQDDSSTKAKHSVKSDNPKMSRLKKKIKSASSRKAPLPDMTKMSDFKRRLLSCVLNPKKRRRKISSSIANLDPRVNFRYEYNARQCVLQISNITININDTTKAISCSQCGYTVSFANSTQPIESRLMLDHIIGKHLGAYQCMQCPSLLSSFKRYKDHMKGHQMQYVCDICEKPLFSEHALKCHRWTHQTQEEIEEALRRGEKDPRNKSDPANAIPCRTCGKLLLNKATLRQHEKTHNTDRERIICSVCGKSLTYQGLVSHQKFSCFPEGTAPPKIECPICQKPFKSETGRAKHMQHLHGKDTFSCEVCGKTFKGKGLLQRHIQRHSEDRPYSCRKQCGSSYKTTHDRSAHEKRCNGEVSPKMLMDKRRSCYNKEEGASPS